MGGWVGSVGRWGLWVGIGGRWGVWVGELTSEVFRLLVQDPFRVLACYSTLMRECAVCAFAVYMA